MSHEGTQKRNRVTQFTLILLVCSLLMLLVGFTYAVYYNFLKGTTHNVIQAGKISFSYNEDDFQGNGVRIENALPISDTLGKVLNGTREYFDFSVNATSTIAEVSYQVIVLKQSQSTLADNAVKVYVTTKNANTEVASPLVVKNNRVLTYQELLSSDDGEGKIVYNGIVPKSEENYHQEFRLRLWIADTVDTNHDYSNRNFSVKVKVVATEVH